MRNGNGIEFVKTLHGVRVYHQGEWNALCDSNNNPILFEDHNDAVALAEQIHREDGSLTSMYRKHVNAVWSPEGTEYEELPQGELMVA